MKKSFMCSLICHNGIVGGALYLDENSVTYKTNKLTVDRAYRKLHINDFFIGMASSNSYQCVYYIIFV